jgi:hypothetical protein
VSRQLCGFPRESIEGEARAASVLNRHLFESEGGRRNFLDYLADCGLAFERASWSLRVSGKLVLARMGDIEQDRTVPNFGKAYLLIMN